MVCTVFSSPSDRPSPSVSELRGFVPSVISTPSSTPSSSVSAIAGLVPSSSSSSQSERPSPSVSRLGSSQPGVLHSGASLSLSVPSPEVWSSLNPISLTRLSAVSSAFGRTAWSPKRTLPSSALMPLRSTTSSVFPRLRIKSSPTIRRSPQNREGAFTCNSAPCSVRLPAPAPASPFSVKRNKAVPVTLTSPTKELAAPLIPTEPARTSTLPPVKAIEPEPDN